MNTESFLLYAYGGKAYAYLYDEDGGAHWSDVSEHVTQDETAAGADGVAYIRLVRFAGDAAEAESLWEARRICSQAMFLLADAKLNEDVCVPARNFIPLLEAMRKITAETGLATPIFGHAADGNLHVHIMYHRADARERAAAQTAIRRVMETVVALDGAITGEHGVGLSKSPFLALQHAPAEIAAMRAVKRALDPQDILGRGKIFTPFNVWDCVPVDVVLPWDKKK